MADASPFTNNAGYTVHTKSLPWLPLAPKVTIKIIKLVPSTGEYSIMVHAEPGGILPRHCHLENAEIYILKGSGAHPQTGEFVEGDYVSEAKGATHDAMVFGHEVELLMVSRGASVFLGEDGTEMYTMDVEWLRHSMGSFK
jgi:quercetin dioxygenase-like cupin family protein